MNKYRVEIDADFIIEASSSDVVRHRLDKLLLKNNFDEKNFTYGISPIGKGDNNKIIKFADRPIGETPMGDYVNEEEDET